MDSGAGRLVLLTGATGFVGSNLWPALERSGYRVRGLTRHVESARKRWPEREWAFGDVANPDALRVALRGVSAAFYLVHGMAEGTEDFRKREVTGANCFADAAERMHLERIVYLGGVAPNRASSEHLRSRQEVGDALRRGNVPCVELRASMIIGHGSLSWLIVRDLAARLPVMILPRWLESRTEPIGIEDVTTALVAALTIVVTRSESFAIPGPEVMTGRNLLERTAGILGLRTPTMISVPLLTPKLSSHWVRFVTRADWDVAREIVVGLKTDLLAPDRRYWDLIGQGRQQSFEEAAVKALREERREAPIPGAWGAVERWLAVHAAG
jgi:uncharacterized protein YbjT (DUF2867 family)